jgi:hypothetical protein
MSQNEISNPEQQVISLEDIHLLYEQTSGVTAQRHQ